jgi:DNA gyrase/topoisomerase IV subunit B
MISDEHLYEFYYKPAANVYELILKNDEFCTAVRKRPGMYVGKLNSDGMYEMIFRLVDEILLNADTKDIQIEILPANTFRIVCNSYKFNQNSLRCSQLLIISNLSEFFECDDSEWHFRTERGIIVSSPYEQVKETYSGISVIFKPNKEIFGDITMDYYRFLDKFIELASLNPYKIIFSDSQNKNIIQIPRGIESLLKISLISGNIIDLSFSAPEVQADIVLSFSNFVSEIQKNYVNNYYIAEGGTHVESMLKGVRLALEKYSKELADEPIDYKDYISKMNYIISIKLSNPRFAGSISLKLRNIEIKDVIASNVAEKLFEKLKEIWK